MAEVFKGIFKVKEEMAELAVVLNKLCICPDGRYFDGRDLIAEAKDEMADVCAALCYLMETNGIYYGVGRYDDKLRKFKKWGLTGIELKEQPLTYDNLPKEKWE